MNAANVDPEEILSGFAKVLPSNAIGVARVEQWIVAIKPRAKHLPFFDRADVGHDRVDCCVPERCNVEADYETPIADSTGTRNNAARDDAQPLIIRKAGHMLVVLPYVVDKLIQRDPLAAK